MNTVTGEFVLPGQGWMWSSTMLRALALFDVDAAATRQALFRNASEGLFERDQDGRRVRWRLSPTGKRGALAAAERLYSFRSAGDGWDGRWLLLDVTTPDDLRRLRLRRRLAWAGFGTLVSGLAITPHTSREPEAARILESLGLAKQAVSLIATLGTIGRTKAFIAEAWDLEDLARRYETFTAEVTAQRPRSDEQTFVAHTRLVHEWRRFPFVDPGLPRELLPARWAGIEARKAFERSYAKWRPGAVRWFETISAEVD